MNSIPTEIRLGKDRQGLHLRFDDETESRLDAEYLRVHSPSAEVQGHGPGQEVLQLDKQDVHIETIEPVGHYALKIVFSDGHDSGLYRWEYLHELAVNEVQYKTRYRERVAAHLAGVSNSQQSP